MSLSVGIVGLPNVGKSTLFNALTKKSVAAENYPFCTIDPSVGIVPVPDKRLDTLTEISKSKKTIPAVIEFVDIAGLVKGASDGEGLGNKFLSNIREVDMIAEVVRVFEDEDIHHVHDAVDPMADIEVINLELIMADQESVSRRLQGVEKEARRSIPDALKEKVVLENLLKHLERGKLANTFEVDKSGATFIKNLHLLTQKPFLYIFNKKNGAYNFDETNDERWEELVSFVESSGSQYVVIDAGVEHELKDLEEDEKKEFRREYATLDSGIDSLIRGCYTLLGLISFFTTGEKETRAWTIKRNSTAPVAGGAIHTDFKDNFIRALVVSFDTLVESGSLAKARDAGKLRTEGREYVVKDGDVIEFLVS
jgi:GTP-binding protein YchF